MTAYTQSLVESSRPIDLETSGTSLSLVDVRDAIGQLVPQIVDRFHRDPFFRESLLEDTKTTIQSLLASSGTTAMQLPDYLTISIREDSANRMHLLIPHPYATTTPSNAPNDLLSLLSQASNDPELRDQLLHSPARTLEQELSLRSGQQVRIPSDLEVVVVPQDAHEFAIVIPERPLDRVFTSEAIEAEFDPESVSASTFSSCWSCQCWSSDCWSSQCWSRDCWSWSSKC
jgi:hypothetical protein